jgi:predicted CXXCH cytochrome family protein
MRHLIRFVTRKSRGGVAVHDEIVEGDKITIGRGNDCGIHLLDPRVLLHHAEISIRGDLPYVSSNAGADIRLNGNLVHIGRLETGDKIRVGPYEIELLPPQEGYGISLSVELVQAMGDDLDKLVAQSHIKVSRLGLTMRSWVWALAAAVLIGTFIVPLILNIVSRPTVGAPSSAEPDARGLTLVKQTYDAAHTGTWSTGGISGAHKFFGAACETCHEKPFVQVRNAACMSCHAAVSTHAQPARFPFSGMGEGTCQSCHKEHQGSEPVVRRSEKFCADCHNDMTKKTAHSQLHDVSDFASGHPEFRPAVMKNPALRETDNAKFMGGTPKPTEYSGLKFPHEKHLRETGVRDPVRGNVVLECSGCHTPSDSGAYMKPISFERHCHGCHELKFDKFVPDRELVHDKPENVFKQIHDIYDALALRGGYEEPAAPAVLRRRPGTPLQPTQRKAVSDWAAAKSAEVLNGNFGRGLCNECHETIDIPPKPVETTASGPAPSMAVAVNWTITPVALADIWMPRAAFTHARHADVACADCHKAKTSHAASDVLMPGIAVCQTCHGGEKATDRVPSTCVSCHTFHHKNMPSAHGMTQTINDTMRQSPRRMSTPGTTP